MMTHPSEGLLASDADRDAAASALADAVAAGRLSLADRNSGRDGSPREPLLRLRGTCLGGSFRLSQG
jgi:Domain of unknown function (DUF1707)